MNDHQVATATDRIRLIAIETMKGAFGNEGALLPFCDKSMSVGANGLADLETEFEKVTKS